MALLKAPQSVCLVIPTYGEGANLPRLLSALWESLPILHILIVNDESGDNTPELLKANPAYGKQLFCLERTGKLALASAYRAGFAEALSRGYDTIAEMDADFSHDPAALPQLLAEIPKADLVLGSRYVDGVRVINWDAGRLLLSMAASFYVRKLTRMPFQDPTGGFRVFRADLLRRIPFHKVRAQGYAFQIEVLFWAWMLGAQIVESPIFFTERSRGVSKMNRWIAIEAIGQVCRLALLRVWIQFAAVLPSMVPGRNRNSSEMDAPQLPEGDVRGPQKAGGRFALNSPPPFLRLFAANKLL